MRNFIISVAAAALFAVSPAFAQATAPPTSSPPGNTATDPATGEPTAPATNPATGESASPGTNPATGEAAGTSTNAAGSSDAVSGSEAPGSLAPSPVEENRLDPSAPSGLRVQIDPTATGATVTNPAEESSNPNAPGISYNSILEGAPSTNGTSAGVSGTGQLPAPNAMSQSLYPRPLTSPPPLSNAMGTTGSNFAPSSTFSTRSGFASPGLSSGLSSGSMSGGRSFGGGHR